MYLWCANCYHAHLRENWRRTNDKYGVCPTCGSSEYHNAVPWETIAAANAYPSKPDPQTVYFLHPVLF